MLTNIYLQLQNIFKNKQKRGLKSLFALFNLALSCEFLLHTQ